MSLRVAIYARKSTDDSDKEATARSTTGQREACVALIERQGWTLAEDHVYVDEAQSGAVFDRPGLLHLMDAVKAKPRPFDVLVMYAEDRLGRDVVETGYLVKQIVDHGVRLFFADGSERKLDSATDALLMAISNFGAQFERERATIRTRDKMFSKAARGEHTGGRVYGYDSIQIDGHAALRLNEKQAKVVRRLFTMAAQGVGIKKIASTLNDERVPGPKGQWSKTGVRDMLRNERYRGAVTFGKTTWVVKKGERKKVDVPEGEWKRVENPDLEIVPKNLWEAAQQAMAAKTATHARLSSGRLVGKPERSAMDSKYLLSGLIRCGLCMGAMVVSVQKGSTGRRHTYYVCAAHNTKGKTACANNHNLRAEEIHTLVLDGLRQEVLTEERLDRVIRGAIEDRANSPVEIAERRQELEAQLAEVNRAIDNLHAFIEEGGAEPSTRERLKKRVAEERALRAKLEHADGLAKAAENWDSAGSAKQIRAALLEWRTLLDGSPEIARQVVRKLVLGSVIASWSSKDRCYVFGFHVDSAQVVGILGHGGGSTLWVAPSREGSKADLDAELLRLLSEIPSGQSVVPGEGVEPSRAFRPKGF